jgi:hypothetical protein
MVVRVLLEPHDGWGFVETVDGELAVPFHAEIDESGVDCGGGILGWRGRALDGKYANARLEMTPRNKPFSGPVVLSVRKHDRELFNGIAFSEGLERSWQ